MRIAMFTETFLPGTDGIVTRLCATLKHLHAAGHEVLLFAPEGGPETYESARVVGLPLFSFFLYPEKKFAFPRRKIGRALKAFDPDLIHVVIRHSLDWAESTTRSASTFPWWLRITQMYLRTRATTECHRLEPALWWYFRTLHNFADVNLCTSKAMLQELEVHRFRNLGLWSAALTWNDTPMPSARRKCGRLCGGDSTNKKILLYVGRLAPKKVLNASDLAWTSFRTYAWRDRGRRSAQGAVRACLSRHTDGVHRVFGSANWPKRTLRPTVSCFRPPPRRSAWCCLRPWLHIYP